MKIHHLNLLTMCPFGGRLFDGGDGSVFATATMVAHALLVETNDGLVLVDTGVGLDDVRSPMRLGVGFILGMRPAFRAEDTALRQVERLGFKREDVRHVVVTHLDVDHAGGIPDFPEAKIHVHRAEHGAAMARATLNERNRYREVHFSGTPRWELHEQDGDTWFGFESVRAVAEDVLIIPLYGHTRGHCAVAVRAPAGAGYGAKTEWLLHGGDAYFHHEELDDPSTCPLGLRLFQRGIAVDDGQRVANATRLRALHRESSDRVRIFSAHSQREYDDALRATTTPT